MPLRVLGEFGVVVHITAACGARECVDFWFVVFLFQGRSTRSAVALDGGAGRRDGIDVAPALGWEEGRRVCLEEVSNEDLEKELLRRRENRGRGPKTREESVVVVESSFEGSCTSDGGVCVPCFEIA